MLDTLLTLSANSTITLEQFVWQAGASILLGLASAYIYMFKNRYSKSFVITLALLPLMVQLVIMIVNGNLGAGVAVMGAFSLIRFRSIPGTARDIGSIFFSMAIGLATGMGYITVAILFAGLVGAMTLLLNTWRFGEQKSDEKDLKITIPESLDYDGLFDDLFVTYLKHWELTLVKTTNMGSLFELHYRVELKEAAINKAFIDALRCRNGNLNISLSKIPMLRDEL